jgi:uncharacterized membrane protein YfcA
MLFDAPSLFMIAFGVIVLGISKGGIAGLGVIVTPLLSTRLDPFVVVSVLLPIMVIQDAVGLVLYRHNFDSRLLKQMLPAGIVGVGLAYLFSTNVPVWGVKIGIGILALSFAVFHIFRAKLTFSRQKKSLLNDKICAAIAGITSGFTSALAHAGPPPFQVYAMTKNLEKRVFVGTSVMFFAAVNLAKLPSYAALDLFTSKSVLLSLTFVPLAIVASWAGAKLILIIDQKVFNIIIKFTLLGVGLILLFQGAIGFIAAN